MAMSSTVSLPCSTPPTPALYNPGGARFTLTGPAGRVFPTPNEGTSRIPG